MFLLKDTLNKVSTCLPVAKRHCKDRAIQKHGQDVDPRISVKLEIADLKKNGKAIDYQSSSSWQEIKGVLSQVYLFNFLMSVKLVLTDS